MTIHLIRSEELSIDLFKSITASLCGIPGPIKYTFEEAEYMEEIETTNPKTLLTKTWEELFNHCEDYRRSRRIPEDEVVVLLTDHRNELNWYSGWQEGKQNFFIQTSMWELFSEGNSIYPVIYELASIPLYITTHHSQLELEKYAHRKSKGCPYDMCADKTDVMLRLRTADLCNDCLTILKEKEIGNETVRQVIRIYEDVREKLLFREHFQFYATPSRLEIDKYQKKLTFIDLGNVIQLSPIHFTVYVFFLKHANGIQLKDLYIGPRRTLYIQELQTIYNQHSNRDETTSPIEAIANRRGPLYTIISRINKSLTHALGRDMAAHYTICSIGDHIQTISLDRSLVTFED